MSPSFNAIGLIGKYGDPGIRDILKTLSDYLQRCDRKLLLDESTADLLPGHGLETASRERIGTECDLAIIIGGDGTLLNAARSLASHDLPLLGINRGRLGFLSDISPDEMLHKLDGILQGDYYAEKRILLHAETVRDGVVIKSGDALNDVVVHKWNHARMIDFEICINGQFVNFYRSDGIIVATPTGSTAYALSSGGPILHPGLNVMVLVPISPHTMSNRPIVIDGESQVEIIVKRSIPFSAEVTCDGQISLGLNPGDLIKISKNPRTVSLIHPSNHDHYALLRAKLHWGGRL